MNKQPWGGGSAAGRSVHRKYSILLRLHARVQRGAKKAHSVEEEGGGVTATQVGTYSFIISCYHVANLPLETPTLPIRHDSRIIFKHTINSFPAS